MTCREQKSDFFFPTGFIFTLQSVIVEQPASDEEPCQVLTEQFTLKKRLQETDPHGPALTFDSHCCNRGWGWGGGAGELEHRDDYTVHPLVPRTRREKNNNSHFRLVVFPNWTFVKTATEARNRTLLEGNTEEEPMHSNNATPYM